jgi:2-methylcitrate dehydratase PrpD
MVLSRPIPRNSLKDICLQHMVKIMLLDKTATFRSAHDKTRMKDPAVLLQRAKVEVLADPRIHVRRLRREAIGRNPRRARRLLQRRVTSSHPFLGPERAQS